MVQYMSGSDQRVEGPGRRFFGQQVTKADFTRLVQLADTLRKIEDYVGSILDKYSSANLPECSEEALCREHFAFAVRVGKKILSKKDDVSKFPFAELEAILRNKLKVRHDILPLHEQDVAAPAAIANKKRSHDGVDADAKPELQFDGSGLLVQDFAIEARERGLSIGSHVKMVKLLRGVQAGALGIVQAFEAGEVVVNFNEIPGAASGSSEATAVRVTLKSLTVVSGNEAAEAAAAAAKKAKVEEKPLLEGIPWVARKPSDAASSIDKLIRGKIFELYMANVPKHESVRFLVEPDGGGFGAIAAAPMKPQTFVALPFSDKIVLASENAGPVKPHVSLHVLLDSQDFYYHILAPAEIPDVRKEVMRGPDDEPIDHYVVYPFWWCRVWPTHSESTAAETNLFEGICEVEVPLCSFKPRVREISRGGATKGQLIMKVPYLTNLQELAQGAWLTSAKKK